MVAVKIFILVAFVAGAFSLPSGSQGKFVKIHEYYNNNIAFHQFFLLKRSFQYTVKPC